MLSGGSKPRVEEVHVKKHQRDRKLQLALLQFFKPANDFEVRQALLASGRGDLIGSGCYALIPATPPKAALQARMDRARRDLTEGRYVYTVESGGAPKAASAGYRPHRKTARESKHRPR